MATGTILTGSWKLLWANSNPEVDFAAQTVNLESNNCELFAIVPYFFSNRPVMDTPLILRPNDSGFLCAPSTTNQEQGTFSGMIIRKVSCTQSTMTFEIGRAVTTSANTQRNDALVPVAIYGIKLGA